MGDKNSEKNNDKNGKTDYGKAEYYYNRELSWLTAIGIHCIKLLYYARSTDHGTDSKRRLS